MHVEDKQLYMKVILLGNKTVFKLATTRFSFTINICVLQKNNAERLFMIKQTEFIPSNSLKHALYDSSARSIIQNNETKY